MVLRTRSRASSRVGGATWYPTDPEGTRTLIVYEDLNQNTVDVHGKLKRPDGSLPPSFFESTRITRSPRRMSRPYINNNLWIFDNREFYDQYSPPSTGYPDAGSTARINANLAYSIRLLAETNPFTPVFSIPVAIKELVDVASMFNLAMTGFLSYAGGQYLNYRFGWKAFVADIKILAGIMKELEQRISDFNYMVEHGHMRKKKHLDSWSGVPTSAYTTFHSAYGAPIRGDLRIDTTMETWGSVTWGLNGDKTLPLDELSRFNRAVSVIFDLEDIDAATMWELLPFSWLVDYFLNVGDLLHSQTMRYEVQPYDVCIMRHYTARARVIPTVYNKNISISGDGVYLREIKTRDWVIPPTTSTLSFDLLRGDRWKVIAALIAKFATK